MVGGLVQQQEVVLRPQQAGQPDPVALPDGQFRQPSRVVGFGPERLQGDLDPAFGVPGLQRLGPFECAGVAFVGPGFPRPEGEARGVEFGERRQGVGDGVRDDPADGALVLGGHLLFGQAERADQGDGALVGHERSGHDVQERGLAPTVLPHDRDTGGGGDGQVGVEEDPPGAPGDGDSGQDELGARTRGKSGGHVFPL